MPRDIFIFIRTKTSIQLSHEVKLIKAVISVLPAAFFTTEDPFGRRRMAFGPEHETWQNGVCFRISTQSDVVAVGVGIALELERRRQDIDGLLIWEFGGAMFEFPQGGSAQMFCERIGFDACISAKNQERPLDLIVGGRRSRKFALIMVRARPGNPFYESDVHTLRAEVYGQSCHPVFYFRDGQVMISETPAPAAVISQRALQHFSKFTHWAVVDSSGETRSSVQGNAWSTVDAEEYQEYLDDDVDDDDESSEVFARGY